MATGRLIVEGKLPEAFPMILSPEDCRKYAGQYVCVPSFQEHRVVAAHQDAARAVRLAKEKGYPEPVCFYNPRPEEAQLPSCGAWPDRDGKN